MIKTRIAYLLSEFWVPVYAVFMIRGLFQNMIDAPSKQPLKARNDPKYENLDVPNYFETKISHFGPFGTKWHHFENRSIFGSFLCFSIFINEKFMTFLELYES